jgi:hypothetical protein
MEANCPDDNSSDDAKMGQLLHGYYANPKLDRLVLKPAHRDLLKIADDIDTFIFQRVAEQFQIADNEPFEEGREDRELVALAGTEVATPGHCDRWRLYPEKKILVIIDLKTGFKEVTPAAANYQLRTYCIGGAEEWDAEQIVVAISQPRLSFDRRVTMAAYSRQDVFDASAELTSIRAASARKDAPLVAGDEQCRWCRAKLVCPAYQAAINDGMALVQIEPGTPTKREADAREIVANCSDEQLDRLLVAIQFAGYVADPAKDEARKRKTENPDRLPEWKLGKDSAIREIADTKRAVSLLSLRGELSKDQIFDCASLAIGKLEELYRQKTGCTWKEARDVIEKTIGAVIELKPKRGSLTRVK